MSLCGLSYHRSHTGACFLRLWFCVFGRVGDGDGVGVMYWCLSVVLIFEQVVGVVVIAVVMWVDCLTSQ